MKKENYFGQIIKKERSNHKETMQQLADAIDVKKNTINMWENGGSVPKEDILIKLSQHYKVTVDYLLGNDLDNNHSNNSDTLLHLQRGIKKMDEQELKKAEALLKTVFDDLFEDPGEDTNGI